MSVAPHGHGPECEYVNFVKLHRAIIKVIEYKGIDANTEYQWLKSKKGTREYEEYMEYLFQILKKYFEIETVDIHRTKFTARLKKKYYTKNFINDDGSKEHLEHLAKESKRIIEEKFNYGQKELEEYIKNPQSKISIDILKYNPDRSNLDRWIK